MQTKFLSLAPQETHLPRPWQIVRLYTQQGLQANEFLILY